MRCRTADVTATEQRTDVSLVCLISPSGVWKSFWCLKNISPLFAQAFDSPEVFNGLTLAEFYDQFISAMNAMLDLKLSALSSAGEDQLRVLDLYSLIDVSGGCFQQCVVRARCNMRRRAADRSCTFSAYPPPLFQVKYFLLVLLPLAAVVVREYSVLFSLMQDDLQFEIH